MLHKIWNLQMPIVTFFDHQMALKNAIFLVFQVLQRHLVVNNCNHQYLGTPNFIGHPMNTYLLLKYACNHDRISILSNSSFLFSNFYSVIVVLRQEPSRLITQGFFWYFPKKLVQLLYFMLQEHDFLDFVAFWDTGHDSIAKCLEY